MSLKEYLDGLNGIYTGSPSNQAGLDQRYQRQVSEGYVSPLQRSLQLLGERSRAKRAARKLRYQEKRAAREREKREARERKAERVSFPTKTTSTFSPPTASRRAETRPSPRAFTALLALTFTVAFSYYAAPLLPAAWWSWAVGISLVATVPLYFLLMGPLRIVAKTIAVVIIAALLGGLAFLAVILVRMIILSASGQPQ